MKTRSGKRQKIAYRTEKTALVFSLILDANCLWVFTVLSLAATCKTLTKLCERSTFKFDTVREETHNSTITLVSVGLGRIRAYFRTLSFFRHRYDGMKTWDPRIMALAAGEYDLFDNIPNLPVPGYPKIWYPKDFLHLEAICRNGTMVAFQKGEGRMHWNAILQQGNFDIGELRGFFCKWSMGATSTEIARKNPFQFHYSDDIVIPDWMDGIQALLTCNRDNYDVLEFWIRKRPAFTKWLYYSESLKMFIAALSWKEYGRVSKLLEAVLFPPYGCTTPALRKPCQHEDNYLR
jgi:hypothetical protein